MDRREAIKVLSKAGKKAEVVALLRERGDSAQQGYKSIVADESLSDKGRQYQLAATYLGVQRSVDNDLSDMASEVTLIDRGDAEHVFGTHGLSGDPASLIIVRRDADDRVANADAKDLPDMLRRATRSGDEVMARAIVARAVENGDADTVNQFTSDRPKLEAATERLWDVERAESDGTFFTTMWLGNLRPSELSDMHPAAIEALAQVEPTEPAPALVFQPSPHYVEHPASHVAGDYYGAARSEASSQ